MKNVSVIIPTYNRAHILKWTISSYIQQVTLEIIIVDDGSSDNTKEMVRRLQEKNTEIKYIKLKKHMGLTFAKNVGVKKAKGQYIFFGDDDACLYEGTLFRLRDALEKFPADIAQAHGSYATEWAQIQHMENYIAHYFYEPFKGRCIMNFDTGKINFHYKIEKITEGLCVMACFMIKTEIAKTVKFDKGYIGNAAREDMDYLLQHAENGRKMVYVPDAYEIDIPHYIVKSGGCYNHRPWKIYIYNIKNFNYFIDKHYAYLKQEGYISVSKSKAKWIMVRSMICDNILPLIKSYVV